MLLSDAVAITVMVRDNAAAVVVVVVFDNGAEATRGIIVKDAVVKIFAILVKHMLLQ